MKDVRNSFAQDGSAVERQVRRMKSFSMLKKVALSASAFAAKRSSAFFDAAEAVAPRLSFSAGTVAGCFSAVFGITSAPRGADGEPFDKRLSAAAPAALIFPTSASLRAAAASSLPALGLFRAGKANAADTAKDAAALELVKRPLVRPQPALCRRIRPAAAMRNACGAAFCGFDPARLDVVSVRSMDMESGLRSAEASFASADAFRRFPRLRDFAHGLKPHVLPVSGVFFPNVGLRSSVGRPGLEVR